MTTIEPNLALWTYDTILDVVENHSFEPSGFDYKEVLRASGQNYVPPLQSR